MQTKKTVVTPGGRVGDDASHNRSPRQNWVDKAGGLPRYIRIVRNGLMKHGHSEGAATALAVAAMKRWAHGGDHVSPKVQAAAEAALAEWEKMKSTKSEDDEDFELKTWQEDLHPRGKEGQSNGGKFVAKNGSDNSKPSEASKKKGTPYKIKKGDTLSQLAETFHTTVEDLMKMNPQIKDKDLIYAGDTLTLPEGSDAPHGDPPAKAKESAKEYIARLKREANAKQKGSSSSSSSSGGSGGGSGGSGSSSGGSGGSGSSRGGSGKHSVSSSPEHAGLQPQNRKHDTYKIAKGDTLSRLAERWGTTVAALMKANPQIKDADKIEAGADLKIPHDAKHKPGQKSDNVSEDLLLKHVPVTLLAELHDHIDTTTETKDATMELEFKEVGVTGLTVDDAENGIVTTLVSVTGVRDNVKDVIHPGAYTKSLNTRIPKGVWSHAWDTPVSKTLDVKELMPGDADLPTALPNGAPWPEGAGALKVKTQFNLETQRGREAYSDVVFFGDQQEWSIGYQVPVGGARIDSKTGIRHIDYLELYEYSPVLFGAMPAARTTSVKDAQTAFKSMTMPIEEFKSWASEMNIETKDFFSGAADDEQIDQPEVKARRKNPKPPADDEEVEAATGVYDDDDEEDGTEKKALLGSPTAYEYDILVKARDVIDFIIEQKDAATAGIEPYDYSFFEDETKGLADIIEANSGALGDLVAEMKDAAEAFDMAYDINDVDGMNEFGNDVLEVVEKALNDNSDDKAISGALHKVAAGVASMAPDEEDPEEDMPQDENDTEKKKPLPPKPGKKEDFVRIETKELDALRVGLLDNFRR